ncbi:g3673 [Coccomyxa elongata]
MLVDSVRSIDARLVTLDLFESYQARNEPIVLKGLVRSWPALHAWTGEHGSKNMASLAGKASVQVMVSEGGLYRGDMEHRSSMVMAFKDFLCSDRVNMDESTAQQLYLAQAPLETSSAMESSLSALLADIVQPECLQGQEVSHVNLWMCTRGSRSSLHYDPYHNLLCMVTGSKRVRCMSPATTQWLYPQPLYGESPNHSAVDFAQPDLARHPLYAEALQHQLSANLQAGDALFLPEGWWHQIDSEAVTIAVNFWWRSPFDRLLGTHMDAYYLRRIAQSLTEARKADLLQQLSPQSDASSQRKDQPDEGPCQPEACASMASGGCGATEPKAAAHASEGGLESRPAVAGSEAEEQSSGVGSRRKRSQEDTVNDGNGDRLSAERLAAAFSAELLAREAAADGPRDYPGPEDGVGLCNASVRLMAGLDCWALRRVLLQVARQFPRTLEAFLCGGLSPAAAELLTARFEAADAQLAERGKHSEQQRFYEELYAVVEEPESVLQALVRQKEEFAQRACSLTLQEALQLPCCWEHACAD